MRLVSSIVLFACVASTLAQSPTRPVVPGKPVVAQARDGAHHGGGGHGHGGGGGGHGHGGGGGGHGHGGGVSVHGGGGSLKGGLSQGYGAPAKPTYSAPPKQQSYGPPKEGNTGYYYYYYPVVPERKHKKGGYGGGVSGGYGGGGKQKGMFGKMVETIMYPIMYPIMRMYDYFDGRSFSGRSSDFVPNALFDKVAKMVQEEIYKEECLSRLICQLGKSAKGYETFVELSSFFLPAEYQDHMKTFKEAALSKNECHTQYVCKSLSPKQSL